MNGEKQCSRCSKVKPLERFSKGYSFCRDCFNAYHKEYRRINKEKESKKQHEYRNTERGKQVKKEGRLRYDTRYPEKKVARCRVAAAVELGRLIRQPCEVCGATDPVEAHHDDYSKPLDVRWLCKTHHTQHHRSLLAR